MKFFKILFFPFWKFTKHMDCLFEIQTKYMHETFYYLRKFDLESAKQSFEYWMQARQRINSEIADLLDQPHTEIESFEVWLEETFKVR